MAAIAKGINTFTKQNDGRHSQGGFIHYEEEMHQLYLPLAELDDMQAELVRAFVEGISDPRWKR